MTAPSRMRVLHVIKGLDAGGAEELLVLAARHRDRESFDVEVAFLLPGHEARRAAVEAEGVPTTCLRGTPWWDPRWVWRLRRLVREGDIDLVHAHSPLVAAGVRLAARTVPAARRPKVVVTLHNMWRSHHLAVRLADRATQGWDDLRLAVSDAVRRSLPGRTRDGVETVVHGIDGAELRRKADRDRARRDLGAEPGDVVVGTVANLRANKAYPDLVAAAALVAADHPEARFVAIGQGPLRAELEARRDAAGLGERMRFLGHRPDAAGLVAGFDVFCLSSHHEGLPVALMEALALGTPVVVTDVGGMGEVVTDGVEGRVVPARQPRILARALGEVVGDAELRARLAAGAAHRGRELDAAASVRAVEARYRSLLALRT